LSILRNIKLTIEYDGTDFAGWQSQKDQRTVQGEIEKAIKKLTSEPVTLAGSGRTDAGAHALGQVANFKTDSALPLQILRAALNALLPDDILIRETRQVQLEFHSRHSAKSKIYRYRIYLGETSLQRNYVWQFRFPVSLSNLKKASKMLLGKKDFSSFCVAKSRKESNICKIKKATWKKSGQMLEFEIEADRFLHSMVRIIVGTLLEVGRGRLAMKDFGQILSAKDRRKAGRTAPACGLYLVEVRY
jgi:tRNA pseudouridine38-40 synthase